MFGVDNARFTNIVDFDTLNSFYNEKNGIYPIKGLTNSMIINGRYITSQTKDYTWGGGVQIEKNIILADNDTVEMNGFRNNSRDEKRVRTCTHKFK